MVRDEVEEIYQTILTRPCMCFCLILEQYSSSTVFRDQYMTLVVFLSIILMLCLSKHFVLKVLYE